MEAVEWVLLVLVSKWWPPVGLVPRVLPKTTATSVFVPAVSHSCVLPLQETST